MLMWKDNQIQFQANLQSLNVKTANNNY